VETKAPDETRKDSGGWRIEGPGKERARIAYAAVDGGKISYEIESSGKQALILVSW